MTKKNNKFELIRGKLFESFAIIPQKNKVQKTAHNKNKPGKWQHGDHATTNHFIKLQKSSIQFKFQ